ncbi:hypothetical protein AB0A74_01665 [Saccharothrix sp. NPDC042600]|uniref:hypothetical protein n=1 Tax=Saccharothrix TaxID=2071 RepID=UPI0033DD3237|nr:hypothetical protein GCM10017745_50490 [Saccharothrix mutabilis subsp. capreolus]
MTHAHVSSEDLLSILNAALAQREECLDCTFVGPLQPRAEPYPDGGNWTRSLTVRGRPADPQACGEAAAEVIADVAARFNLARN